MKQSRTLESVKPLAAATADPGLWELRLYVAGKTAKSVAAFENLKRLCEEHLPGKYTIEVVDLLLHPQLAKGDQIARLHPAPRESRSIDAVRDAYVIGSERSVEKDAGFACSSSSRLRCGPCLPV